MNFHGPGQFNIGPALRQITCPHRPESQKATLNFPSTDTKTSANMQVVGSRVVSTLFIPDSFGLHDHACNFCCGCTGPVSVFYSKFNSVVTSYHFITCMFPVFPIMVSRCQQNVKCMQPKRTAARSRVPRALLPSEQAGDLDGPSVLWQATMNQHRGKHRRCGYQGGVAQGVAVRGGTWRYGCASSLI